MTTELGPHSNADDVGKLVLRVLIGALILLHGISKIISGPGPGPLMQMLGGQGYPPELGYLVYIGEVLAPLMLIVGIWVRPAALVIVVNMLFAIVLAHLPDVLKLNAQGGWAIELQALYLFGAFACFLLGAGHLSLGGRHGRWN